MKRKISIFLALIMVMSAALTGAFNMTVFAADSFAWNFADQTVGNDFTGNIAADTQNVTGKGVKSYTGITTMTATLNSGPVGNTNEGAGNIVTDDQSTKWCASGGNAPTPGPNLNFIIDLSAGYNTLPKPVAYVIRGANDDAGNSGRCLSAFNVAGSNDLSNWTALSSQSGVSWGAANYYLNFYEISPTQNYRYYRLNITARCNADGTGVLTSSGTMQFSYFGMVSSYQVIGSDTVTNYLYPYISENPGAMADGNTTPWNGPNVLTVNGSVAGGSGTVAASSYTTIKSGLSINVYPDTKLSYVINPQDGGNYNYGLDSCFQSIDLKFSDGTRLKDLGAQDIYGFPMTPAGQGKARVYVVNSWNYVESNIGKVAAGKVITDIIVGYENPAATRGALVRADYDDLKVFERDDAAIIANTELADYTDVRFGTRVGAMGMGANSPLVGTPNPFNYWVPCTATANDKPYNSQDRSLYYIRMSHIASRWFGESCILNVRPDAASTASRQVASSFVKDNEIAHSYYYSVTFDANDPVNPGVKMEVTPTEHAAVFRFTFPAGSAQRTVQISGLSGTPAQGTAAGDGANTFTAASSGSFGMRTMQVYGQFSTEPSAFTAAGGTLVAQFAAAASGPTVVEMRLTTSQMTTAQAKQNMNLEMDPADNFDAVKAKSKAIWNRVLSAAAVDDPTASYWDLVDFYSKFARSTMYPTIMHENTQTGTIDYARANPKWQYMSPFMTSYNTPVDGPMSYNEGFWDTFRTKWTMLSFFRPHDAGLLFDGVVDIFKDNNSRGSFAVPRWIKPAGQNLMVMTSSDVVAAEMYARKAPYDYKAGYDAALKSSTVYTSNDNANGGRNGIKTSIFDGYSAYGQSGGTGGGSDLSLSWSLEGCVNDAGTAKMAKGLRDEALAAGNADLAKSYDDESKYFENRAKYYTLLFNPAQTGGSAVNSLGWFQNKNRAGAWLGGAGSAATAFNALDWGWGFCEDNAFAYCVTAPQDGRGLANLYGGKKAFGDKLDYVFSDAAWKLYGNGGGYGGMIHEAQEKREVKIGQWGLSNEPGEHMPYMYLFSDRPQNAAKYVRMGMQQAGGSIQVGRGMIGEEDNGAMASWWVWAYLGIFPLDNGSGNVVLGSPRFKKVTFTLDDGRSFVFEAPNAAPQNCYVNGVKINGVPYDKLYFTQDLFANGNVFTFDMGSTPTGWAASAEQPPSLTQGDGPQYAPSILMDITTNAAATATMPAATSTTKALVVDAASMTTANAAYLCDNDASTATAPFASNPAAGSPREITYYSPTPVKVEMYTLTSSTTTQAADPKTWTLQASNDGLTWAVLDSRDLPNITTVTNTAIVTGSQATRTDETFRWRGQTKPFAIDAGKQGKYKYYKLSITAASSATVMQLSQIELLADKYYDVSKDTLLAAINNATAIKAAQEAGPAYGNAEYAAMIAQLTLSQAVYDNPNALGQDIAGATDALNTAMAALIKLQPAWVPFLAVDDSANNYRVTVAGGAAMEPLTAISTTNGVPGGPALLDTLPITGTTVTGYRQINNTVAGSTAAFKYIDFGKGDRVYTQVSAVYQGNENSTNNGCVYVRLDDPKGRIIATVDCRPTAVTTNWGRYAYGHGNISTPNITGVHTVYLEFYGTPEYAGNFHSFQFESVQPAPYALVERDRSEAAAPPYAALTTNVLDFLNASGGDLNLNVITATYNAAGSLINLDTKPVISLANTRMEISPASVTAPDGQKVRLFVWLDDGTYTPAVTARNLN